ncbi:DUF3027 domain-containing protein [Actinomyces faecalis]|uniref:DUF3027 domain-containing protein n=1 Tax=Actinomyces faecalis TaxID=2722820 RepID=UPI002E2C9416|nr:DUF3027 domain-containing protein [Actinomyces faecalis]
MTRTATEPETATATETGHPAPGQVGTLADPATASLDRPGSLPTKQQAAAAAKDKVLSSPAAVELAHEFLGQITEPLSVGAHMGARREGERVVTHLFECNLAGYRGWRWAVTLTRPPRARSATVCEMELLPGEEAILAPAWIPWADRLQPGDVSRSDRLPRRETDERLEPGWEATGEEEGDVVGTDALDFGRARVLSAEGVQRAAQRWYDGDHGPEADGVRKAHAACATCGFLVPLAGPLRNVFGICANEWAADDGRVVSLDHGCGAHSETDLPDQGPEWPVTPSRLDEAAMEPLGTDGTSIRGGRNQAEEVEASSTQEQTQADAGDGQAEGARDSVTQSQEADQDRDDPDNADDAAAPAQQEPAGRSKRSARPAGRSTRTSRARSSRAAGSRSRKPEAETASATREAEQDEVEDSSSRQRHASALDAVAELAAATAHEHEDAPRTVPTTLDELEAQLPFGG